MLSRLMRILKVAGAALGVCALLYGVLIAAKSRDIALHPPQHSLDVQDAVVAPKMPFIV